MLTTSIMVETVHGRQDRMVTFDLLSQCVQDAAQRFPIKRVDLFGSFAKGCANEDSDIDLLVEFDQDAVSLLTLSALKASLEDAIDAPVDLIHGPLPEDSFLDVKDAVALYER